MNLGVTGVMLYELDFDEQIDLCQSLGLKFYQYRPRPIPDNARDQPFSPWGNHKFDLDPQRFLREGRALTRQLRDAGIEPWGTAPNCTVDMPDEQIAVHLEGAAAADAKSIRCQPPAYPREPFNYKAYLDRTIARYQHVVEKLAWPTGIKLLLETHARSAVTAPGLAWNICRHFSPKRMGVIFDIVNFAREGAVEADLAVSVLHDYIDCCHIGGSRRVEGEVDRFGGRTPRHEFCPMEQGDLHMPTWLTSLTLADLNPPLIIEDYDTTITGREALTRDVAYLNKVIATL